MTVELASLQLGLRIYIISNGNGKLTLGDSVAVLLQSG